MAYRAGNPEDPSALVQNISSNIQKLTLLKGRFYAGNRAGQQQVTTDPRQRKLQKERLVNEFSAALNSFQKTQRQAADKEREFVARVRASSRVSGGQPDDGFGNMPPFLIDSQVQAQAEAITEDDLRLIQERESSIRQLESDITDINDIFKDLGMMVHEQGDMIDSIEANVESADVHRSSRKKICILMIVLAVVSVVIGLIIWGAVKK
ncbi:hypothetical protein F7725_019429 [Dissostichus mawsoni]|uniref:Syntaxin-7 n=1 Tax=Dissostichus mawsoni TaxID=36200 RepID=A0A7J5YK14_DISMA|nr:hypothetical protein F7725_019429 [Dissostichus mawsoni]